MAKSKTGVAGWGELNIALNGVVKTGAILGYKTNRPENGGAVGIEVATARGTDQAEAIRIVRDALPATFSDATIRTREG